MAYDGTKPTVTESKTTLLASIRANTDALDGRISTNTSHSTGDGSDHSDVATNTTHSGTTTGNPHSVTKTEVSLGSVTNDAQLKASQLQTTITDDDTKVPSSGAVVDYVTASSVGYADTNNGNIASISTSYQTVCALTLTGAELSGTSTSIHYIANVSGSGMHSGTITVNSGTTTPEVSLMVHNTGGYGSASTEILASNVWVKAVLTTNTVSIQMKVATGGGVATTMIAGGGTV